MLGCGGIEQKGKRTHGHGQKCGDCPTVWGRGIRKLKGKVKNAIKIKLKKSSGAKKVTDGFYSRHNAVAQKIQNHTVYTCS